jgi:hypothetical protein
MAFRPSSIDSTTARSELLRLLCVDSLPFPREPQQLDRLVEQELIGITELPSTRRPLDLSLPFKSEGRRFEPYGARY